MLSQSKSNEALVNNIFLNEKDGNEMNPNKNYVEGTQNSVTSTSSDELFGGKKPEGVGGNGPSCNNGTKTKPDTVSHESDRSIKYVLRPNLINLVEIGYC